MIRLVSILVCMYRCDLWPALAISPPIRCYLVNTRQLRISQSVPKEFPERIPIIVVSFVSLVPLESGCHEGNRIWPEYLVTPWSAPFSVPPKQTMRTTKDHCADSSSGGNRR